MQDGEFAMPGEKAFLIRLSLSGTRHARIHFAFFHAANYESYVAPLEWKPSFPEKRICGFKSRHTETVPDSDLDSFPSMTALISPGLI